MTEDEKLQCVEFIMNGEKAAEGIGMMLDVASKAAMSFSPKDGADIAAAAKTLKTALSAYQAAVSRFFFNNVDG